MAYYQEGFADENALNLAIHQFIGEVDELYANVEEHQATWQATFGESGNPPMNPVAGCDRTLIWEALTPIADLDDTLPFLFEQAIEDSRAHFEEHLEWFRIADGEDSPLFEEAEEQNQKSHAETQESRDEAGREDSPLFDETEEDNQESQSETEESRDEAGREVSPLFEEAEEENEESHAETEELKDEGTESRRTDNKARLEIKSSDGVHIGIRRVDGAVTRLQSLLISCEGVAVERKCPPTLQRVQRAARPISVGTDSQQPTSLSARSMLPTTAHYQRASCRGRYGWPRRASVRPKIEPNLNKKSQSEGASSIVIRSGTNEFKERNECHEATQRLSEGEFTGNVSRGLKHEANDHGESTSHITPMEEENPILPESEGDASRRRPWLEANASALIGTSNTPASDEPLESSQPINIPDRFKFLQDLLSEHIDSVCEEFREISELVFFSNSIVNKHLKAALRELSQAKCEIRKNAVRPREEINFGNLKQEFFQRAINRLKCNAMVTGVPKKPNEDVRDILKRISYALGYPVDDMYVKDAYRLSGTDLPPPIIVKFKYETMKDELVNASSRMELLAGQLGISVGRQSRIRVLHQLTHSTLNL